MRWLTGNVDVVGIGIATLAIVISLTTVVFQRQARARDTFLRIHELLSSSDLREGRRLVYEAGRANALPADDAELHRMNQAVGAYDTVGMYVRRRLVPKRWVLDVWHHSLRDIGAGAILMADHRQAQHHWRPWPDLWPLLREAEKFRTHASCCEPSTLSSKGGEDDDVARRSSAE